MSEKYWVFIIARALFVTSFIVCAVGLITKTSTWIFGLIFLGIGWAFYFAGMYLDRKKRIVEAKESRSKK